MPSTVPTGLSSNAPAFAVGLDTSSFVTKLASVKDARELPVGAIVGDLHGGLTFTDAVAAALEARSHGGWQEIQISSETWTIIVLNH
jgi:crotonobetainyl-CoA:carnitine CoA-transferase CaiB-like acyl-CoA transferase